jgi:hypothetical protein
MGSGLDWMSKFENRSTCDPSDCRMIEASPWAEWSMPRSWPLLRRTGPADEGAGPGAAGAAASDASSTAPFTSFVLSTVST